MKYLFLILLFVTALTISAAAQQATTVQGVTAPTAPTTASKVIAEIIAASATTIVKGAPFSAEATSESTQILADGNKISRTFTTRMYRDSDGRFRREEAAAPIASTGTVGGSSHIISIFDPIGNFRLLLDPTKKTARRMIVPAGIREGAVVVNGRPMSASVRAQVETNAVQRANIMVLPSMAMTTSDVSGKSESLGTRTFEGVEAEGTRTVTTIPAGAIGNERPIEMVYERWYSKELQLIVYSKHSDPRFGEQIYRLENLSRGEPDAALFTAPADYKVITEPTFNVVAPATVRTPVIVRKPE